MSLADVTSANVVGYTTLKIESQYQIIGVNFQDVNGGSLKLNDAIPYQEGMTKGADMTEADQIQIGNSTGGWKIYYLSNGEGPKGTVDGLDGKWSEDGDAAVTDAEIPAGSSFWYIRKDKTAPAFNLSIAGSVCTLPSASYQFSSKYRIFCNPYAVPLKLNDAFPYVAETMTKGMDMTEADQIQIGNSTGGWKIYYLSNGEGPKGTVDGLDGKWSEDGDAAVTDAAIPVGKAAWYVRKDASKPAMNVTFTKPYDL